MRPLLLVPFLAVVLASCSRMEGDVQCLPVPPSSLLRIRLLDSSGADLLRGGNAGIRLTQPCRTDSLQVYYTSYYYDSASLGSVLGFRNLNFPPPDDQDPDPACFRILFEFPSGDDDTLTWRYHIDNGDLCRTPIIEDVRYNGVVAAPAGTDLYGDRSYYQLVKR